MAPRFLASRRLQRTRQAATTLQTVETEWAKSRSPGRGRTHRSIAGHLLGLAAFDIRTRVGVSAEKHHGADVAMPS
jgi:hypothetical protein